MLRQSFSLTFVPIIAKLKQLGLDHPLLTVGKTCIKNQLCFCSDIQHLLSEIFIQRSTLAYLYLVCKDLYFFYLFYFNFFWIIYLFFLLNVYFKFLFFLNWNDFFYSKRIFTNYLFIFLFNFFISFSYFFIYFINVFQWTTTTLI